MHHCGYSSVIRAEFCVIVGKEQLSGSNCDLLLVHYSFCIPTVSHCGYSEVIRARLCVILVTIKELEPKAIFLFVGKVHLFEPN